ncbi:MAG: CvpA family protein [Geobacteraceae bacterium]|jgi:membrane protein required for colicin V production
MNFVDILIWAVLLSFVVKGFWKGFVKEACSLLGLLVGGWAAFKYDHYLAEAIRPFIHLPHSIALVLSFICIFLFLGLLFYLFGYLLTVVCKIMLLGGINRIGGVIFGFLEGALLLCMVLYLSNAKPVPEKVKGWLSRSRTAQAFIVAGREIVSGWEASAKGSRPVGKAD